MLQGYFLARDHFYICDCKFAHGPMEMDEVYLQGYIFRLHRLISYMAHWFNSIVLFKSLQWC